MKKVIITGLIAGIGMTVVNYLFGGLMNILIPYLSREYTNPQLFRSWSDPLMSLYFLVPFYTGIALAFFWKEIEVVLKNKSSMHKGILFGICYFAIVTVPGMMMTLSSFQISFAMVMVWTLGGLLQGITAGLFFARFLSKRE